MAYPQELVNEVLDYLDSAIPSARPSDASASATRALPDGGASATATSGPTGRTL